MKVVPINCQGMPGLLALIFLFCVTSCIAASDIRGSLPVGLAIFGETGHDDRQPVVSPSNALVKELDTDATKYELKCGKKGEYNTFCKALPYQFYCDPTSGKGSARVSNVLCGLVCACKKVSANTAVSADGASDEEEGSIASVPAEVVNTALFARQSVSDIPECALNISLPAMTELNCSDTACICKSEPFFQDQCMEIKEACSPRDALKAIEVGTAICREAGVRVECKTTPVRERDLERRHSWAFICDSAQIKPNYQREFTRECEQKGYQCTSRGKMISKGSRGDTLCLAACRCVSVYSNCSPSYDRPKLDFWYEYCGVWKAAADADLTTTSTKEDQGGPLDIETKMRDNVPDDRQDHGIERRSDPEPVLGPWKVWCADADSVRDPLLTGNCQLGGKYGCDASGLVHRSKPSDACEKGCLCVQEECNQWDIECKPSQGEPPGSTSPLVEQCKKEQKCTMDGAYIRKDGKVMDPKSTCASSCYCAYSGTRCLTV